MPQILKNYDDLDWAEKNTETDADAGLHTLALDGAEVELWLSDFHYQELCGRVNRYFKAGRPTRLPKGRKSAVKSPGSGRIVSDPLKRKVMAWVDEVGLKCRTNNAYPAYQDGQRRSYFPKWLWDAYYDAHPDEKPDVQQPAELQQAITSLHVEG